MEDILHKQCDYDPASGESYDFDRLEGAVSHKHNESGEQTEV